MITHRKVALRREFVDLEELSVSVGGQEVNLLRLLEALPQDILQEAATKARQFDTVAAPATS